ncbi:MAG TPA: hypothetical protein VEL82_06435 [Thermoplasmata archaeon]|nr:hypothetical protein [Thermoplasmata archaeon]
MNELEPLTEAPSPDLGPRGGALPDSVDTDPSAGAERFPLYVAARGERGHYPFHPAGAAGPGRPVSPFRLPPDLETALWARAPFPTVLPGTLLPERPSR